MLKRIGLFLLTNIAVIAVVSIIIVILENIFGITISGYSSSYLSVFIFSAIFGFSGAFISLFISKWMAKRLYDIVLITPENIQDLDEKELVVWNTVSKIADNNHIKIPEVGIYRDTEPNAFGVGSSKNNALIAVSTGLLDILEKDEIEALIGHEIAYILNGDMVTMTLLQGVVNTFVIFISRVIANIFDNVTDGKFGVLGYFVVSFVLQIVFGILASLITMKFSRYRAFKADEGSAKYIGKEKMLSLLKALQKVQDFENEPDNQISTYKITGKSKTGIMEIFSAHPPLEDRIKNLESKVLF